jgi:hypothetical protein
MDGPLLRMIKLQAEVLKKHRLVVGPQGQRKDIMNGPLPTRNFGYA